MNSTATKPAQIRHADFSHDQYGAFVAERAQGGSWQVRNVETGQATWRRTRSEARVSAFHMDARAKLAAPAGHACDPRLCSQCAEAEYLAPEARCLCSGRKHTCERFAGALVTVRES